MQKLTLCARFLWLRRLLLRDYVSVVILPLSFSFTESCCRRYLAVVISVSLFWYLCLYNLLFISMSLVFSFMQSLTRLNVFDIFVYAISYLFWCLQYLLLRQSSIRLLCNLFVMSPSGCFLLRRSPTYLRLSVFFYAISYLSWCLCCLSLQQSPICLSYGLFVMSPSGCLFLRQSAIHLSYALLVVSLSGCFPL